MQDNQQYQEYHWLPLFELICLMLGSALIFFSLYILPRVMFGWNYEVPHFVIWLETWYQHHHDLDAFLVIFLPFFSIGVVFIGIARAIDKVLDENERHQPPDEPSRIEKFLSKPNSLLKLSALLIAVVVTFLAAAHFLDFFLENTLADALIN